MIDFDAVVHSVLDAAFGQPVTYHPLVSQPAAPAAAIVGIFDRHHEIVLEEIKASEMMGPGHSTTAPVLSVRLVHLAVPPRQGDRVTIGSETFEVWDVQPDGRGMADLVLRERI